MASVAADGQSVAQVEAVLTDAAGRRTTLDEEVSYQLVGDGEIIGVESGSSDDLTPYSVHRRRTLNGRAIVCIRSGRQQGKLTLHAIGRAFHCACDIEQA